MAVDNKSSTFNIYKVYILKTASSWDIFLAPPEPKAPGQLIGWEATLVAMATVHEKKIN